jgi:hypothetical protein
MQTLTGYEWRTYDEKLLDDVSNNDWATAFAKEIAGVNLPLLSQTYNNNYLQRLISTMGDFSDQVVGPSNSFPAGEGRTAFTKWDGEDFGVGEGAGHKKLLVTADGILADMALKKGEGMTQTSIVIKDLARKAAEQTKLGMKLIYSSSIIIEELKTAKEKLSITDEEIDDLRKKAITIPSQLAMTSMKCCSFVCGLPSVKSGTKTLSSVEVNAVAPMMDKLKGNDSIWLIPEAEQFEMAMRTVAHEMEEERSTNPARAGAGAAVERPPVHQADGDAEGAAEKGFTFGTLDMGELHKMDITPMTVPGTKTIPSTKTETKEADASTSAITEADAKQEEIDDDNTNSNFKEMVRMICLDVQPLITKQNGWVEMLGPYMLEMRNSVSGTGNEQLKTPNRETAYVIAEGVALAIDSFEAYMGDHHEDKCLALMLGVTDENGDGDRQEDPAGD